MNDRVLGVVAGRIVGMISDARERRKAIIEPVFGQIHTSQGKHVLLRGLEQAAREWELIAGVFPMFEELEQVVATGGGTESAHDHEPT